MGNSALHLLARAAFVLAMCTGLCKSANAQVDPHVGVRLEVITSRYREVDGLHFAPEVSGGLSFPSLLQGTLRMQIEATLGYRREGPENPSLHSVLFRYQEMIVGARVAGTLVRGIIPLKFSAGMARHFTWAENVSGYSGISSRDYADRGFSEPVVSLGLGAQWPVGRGLYFTPGAHAEVWLGSQRVPSRFGFSAGFCYVLPD